jgi:sulfide:quinone oxidoreductase
MPRQCVRGALIDCTSGPDSNNIAVNQQPESTPMNIRTLTPLISVAPQLSAADMEEAAKRGFRTVIDNRPDNEGADQPSARDVQAAAERSGLRFHFQPVVSGAITPEDVRAFGKLLAQAEAPVLAYCRTGTRCTMLWALAQAGKMSADEIIATAAKAGYDVSALRPKLI